MRTAPERNRPDSALAVVRNVAEELGALEWRNVVVRERLYDAVRDACEAGVAQSTVAVAAGISRQRVHQILALMAPRAEEDE